MNEQQPINTDFSKLRILMQKLGYGLEITSIINTFERIVLEVYGVEEGTEYFLHSFPTSWGRNDIWEYSAVLIRLASCVHYWHVGQEILLETIFRLRQRHREWTDLTEFETELDRQWQCTPLVYAHNAIPFRDNFQYPQWLNLNAFIAKLFNETDRGFASFAISEIRLALESWAPDDEDPRTERLNAAYAWMHFGHCRLYRECHEGSHSTKPTDGNPFGNGILFRDKTTGFSIRRWDFWKRRWSEVVYYGDNIGLGAHPLITMAALDGTTGNYDISELWIE